MAVACLIKHKFGKIVIPDAVWGELVIDGKGKKGVEDIESSDWIKVQPVRGKVLVKVLAKDIDSGESEPSVSRADPFICFICPLSNIKT